MQTTVRARYVNNESVNQIFWTNAPIGQQWYAGGPTRPAHYRTSRHERIRTPT